MKELKVSANLYTFQKNISHLKEMEGGVFDTHKLFLNIPKWHEVCTKLLAMTNEIDYDVNSKLIKHHFQKRNEKLIFFFT